MKNKKRNIKIILGFIVGLIIPSLGIYTAATLANANQVSYNDTDVKAALDKLYAEVDNEYFDYATAQANTSGNVFASKKGICTSRNQTVHCFKVNNWDYEKNHIQQVFSDVSCHVYSNYVLCLDSVTVSCYVYSNGDVICMNQADKMDDCLVDASGTVDCR